MDAAQIDLIADFVDRGRAAQAEVNSIIAKSDVKAHHRPRARKTDPATSHRAAKRAGEKLTWAQQSVLECFQQYGKNGLTDPELIVAYGKGSMSAGNNWPMQTGSGVRTRRHELAMMKDSKIEAIGEVGKGRQFTVWALKRENA